jgi:hypothetical protein
MRPCFLLALSTPVEDPTTLVEKIDACLDSPDALAYQFWMVSLGFFTAEIEIPERVEVFRADGSETEFVYPVRVVAKHLARRARLIGGRWIFELDGRGYYVKDATLTAFGLRPKVTQVPVLKLADFRR